MKIFFTSAFTISLLASHALGMTREEAVNVLRNASNAQNAVSSDYKKYRHAYSVAKKIDSKDWGLYWKSGNSKDLFGKLNHFKKALDSYEASLKNNNSNNVIKQFQNLKLEKKESSSLEKIKSANKTLYCSDTRNEQEFKKNYHEIKEAYEIVKSNFKKAAENWKSGESNLNTKLLYIEKGLKEHASKKSFFSEQKNKPHYNNFVQNNGKMNDSTNEERKALFDDTQTIACKKYNAETENLKKNARLIEKPSGLNNKKSYNTIINVSSQDSIQAALKLIKKGLKPLVLDFANGQNPGGGASTGHGNVQEEQIAYASNLYQGLNHLKNQPQSHDLKGTPFFLPLHGGAYLPDVTFFRDSTKNYGYINPEKISIFASAAIQYNWPRRFNHVTKNYNDAYDVVEYGEKNDSFKKLGDEKVYWETMANKFRSMCDTAISHGHDALVLGAWGCGAFGNNINKLIDMYKKVLAEYKGSFKHIEFAVLGDHNFKFFQNNLNNL